MFIHDAVLESLICGDTQIPASGLIGAIEKLKQRDSETGRTGFETQFHVCHTHLLVHCQKDVYASISGDVYASTSGDTHLCVAFPKGCCLESYFVIMYFANLPHAFKVGLDNFFDIKAQLGSTAATCLYLKRTTLLRYSGLMHTVLSAHAQTTTCSPGYTHTHTHTHMYIYIYIYIYIQGRRKMKSCT